MPNLRFPEFQDEWKSELMGTIYSFKSNNSLSREDLNYENGFVKNIHYGDIHTKYHSLFDITKEAVPFINISESLNSFKEDSYCIEGDMIFADASEDLQDIGKSIEIINLNNEKLLSGMHTILARQIRDCLVIGFGAHLFRSKKIRTQIQKEAQGTKVLGLSANRLSKIEILFPADKAEQQKIADCLSSLDKVISLQIKKIEALQQYKNGLMQKLFPAGGETVPELRFGGFQNEEAWHSLDLGSCLLKRPEYGVNAPAVPFSKELPTYLRITDIAENGSFIHEQKTSVAKNVTDSNYLKKGDIVLARTGASVGTSYLYNEKDGALVFAGFLIRVKPNQKKLNSGFLFQYFKTEQYWKWVSLNSARSGQPGINGSEYSALPIVLPSMQEQQKIADCLSSLDELIVTETQKLDVLRTHKTGLMQQLFPVMDEVNA
ncbi:restriction endonuclease subunit S [Salmonella enterica]|nr:restriction endonuclease subunit S [Salmonella enterica]